MVEAVNLDDAASPEEVTAVTAAFARYGFDVNVSADIYRRSTGALPWLVEIVLAVPIGTFFAAFGAADGQDAYATVREWLRDIRATRAASHTAIGFVELRDPEYTNLVLSTRLPEAALAALSAIDWEQKRGHYITWDAEAGEWRDPTRGDS